ncbi:ribonuclease H-like domain-containing protein [Tanacetum coccineum]
MRAKRYYQRTSKKIFINANDTAGYDKSKVECFNYHKMGHFARECRVPRNKKGQFRNQDNIRKHGNNEDTSSKAMLVIDGVGFDWSDMAEEPVQTNMALMAFSDSELNQTEFTAASYKRGLATVEEQLITYRKNEILFSEEVAVLKKEVACKDYEINVLKNEFEKVKQEKEGIEFEDKGLSSRHIKPLRLSGPWLLDSPQRLVSGLTDLRLEPLQPWQFNSPFPVPRIEKFPLEEASTKFFRSFDHGFFLTKLLPARLIEDFHIRVVCQSMDNLDPRLSEYQDERSDEARFLVRKLISESSSSLVNLKSVFNEFTLNLMMGLIIGKRYSDVDMEEDGKRFQEIVKETFLIGNALNLRDHLPFLRWFGVNELENKLIALQKKRCTFDTRVIDRDR